MKTTTLVVGVLSTLLFLLAWTPGSEARVSNGRVPRRPNGFLNYPRRGNEHIVAPRQYEYTYGPPPEETSTPVPETTPGFSSGKFLCPKFPSHFSLANNASLRISVGNFNLVRDERDFHYLVVVFL